MDEATRGKCKTCSRADGSCPYPNPISHCQQWIPSQKTIADSWWKSLGINKKQEAELSGD